MSKQIRSMLAEIATGGIWHIGGLCRKKHIDVLVLVSIVLVPLGFCADEVSYTIPILLVDQQCTTGQCQKISFRYTRDNSKSPLRISIGEDTPSGSGRSIRNSVWMAAIAVAAQQNDMLNGVRISVDFSGFVDGPSAGGIISLALLNALNHQKKFPMDFAMTGTILPDGTIGTVGGVAHKIRAAARCGMKRIAIPAFLRFEKQKDGSTVDLLKLGRELNVNICPVENLESAYCLLWKRPMPSGRTLSAKEICQLSQKQEYLLLKEIGEWDKALQAMTDNAVSILQENYQEAQQAQEGGNILAAHNLFENSYLLHCGLLSSDRFVEKQILSRYPVLRSKPGWLSYKKYRAALHAFYVLNDKDAENVFDTIKKIPEIKKPSPIAGQLASPAGRVESFSLTWVYPSLLMAETLKNCENKELEDCYHGLIMQRVLLESFSAFQNINSQQIQQLADSLPRCNTNGKEKMVEDFFYKAANAVFDSVDNLIIDGAQETQVSVESLNAQMQQHDRYFLAGGVTRANNQQLHMDVPADSFAGNAYYTTAMIFAQVNGLVLASSLLIKYSELNPVSTEDGDFYYQSSETLHYLIRSARTRAMQNIKKCLDQKIPCLAAQWSFAIAENNRDKQNVDKVHDVLAHYWQASLQAQALQMTFGKSWLKSFLMR